MTLNNFDYNISNALLWGNCTGHWKAVFNEEFGGKTFTHLTLALLETLPILSQIISSIESIAVNFFSDKNDQINPGNLKNHNIQQVNTDPILTKKINEFATMTEKEDFLLNNLVPNGVLIKSLNTHTFLRTALPDPHSDELKSFKRLETSSSEAELSHLRLNFKEFEKLLEDQNLDSLRKNYIDAYRESQKFTKGTKEYTDAQLTLCTAGEAYKKKVAEIQEILLNDKTKYFQKRKTKVANKVRNTIPPTSFSAYPKKGCGTIFKRPYETYHDGLIINPARINHEKFKCGKGDMYTNFKPHVLRKDGTLLPRIDEYIKNYLPDLDSLRDYVETDDWDTLPAIYSEAFGPIVMDDVSGLFIRDLETFDTTSLRTDTLITKIKYYQKWKIDLPVIVFNNRKGDKKPFAYTLQRQLEDWEEMKNFKPLSEGLGTHEEQKQTLEHKLELTVEEIDEYFETAKNK